MQRIVPTAREKDPTGQGGNRKAAKADIARRIRALREPVLDIIDTFPIESITVNEARYQYRVLPERMASLFDELQGYFYRALELDNFNRGWFLNEYLGKAWQQGTVQAFTRLKAVAESVAPDVSEAMNLDSVLSSPEYARRFELISSRAFENMKGFVGQAATDLGRILGEGVALGQSPRNIARDIRKKFKQIEGFRALRIARTEVNHAYNEARYEETKDVRDRLGLEIKIMHVSALVDATRPSHAARHGKIYDLESQRRWWQEGGNRINCICNAVEIVFIDGEPTQKKLIEKQRKRGEAFFAAHPNKR
jgi:SPP1 gp7 family putative phage head morphogenesis protein